MLFKAFILALSLSLNSPVSAGPAITPPAAAALAARAAQFTGVSITPVSIKPVSIEPVTIATPTISSFSLSRTRYGPTPTCTQTIIPDKNGYVPPDTCGALYQYYPSFGAAVLFAVLFGVTLVAHVAQAVMYKKKFCWVICMGATWDFIALAARSASTREQQSTSILLIAQLFVLLAPLWVNAFCYMVLGRMINFLHPVKRVWMIAPSSLASVFVALDIISFIIQLIGGGMAGPGATPEAAKTGVHIYMGGIGMQEFFITVFVGLAIKVHLDMLAAERQGVLAGEKAKWRRLLYALYISLLAITVRIIFRLVEFSRGFGKDNPVPYHEAYFYVLECVPMLIAIGIWNVAHPGSVLQGPDSELPRSWLSRKLCCCCRGRERGRGAHQRMQTADLDEEMARLRARDPSSLHPTGQGDRTPPLYSEGSGPASRDPSPYRDGRSRDPSPSQADENYGDAPPQHDPVYPTHARQPPYGQTLHAPPRGSNA